MGLPKEEREKPPEADLKTQLEDIQRRIDHETEEALSKRASKRRAPFSNILSQRDKRTSMPVFAGSSTHNNVANSTSSKDVNFVVGLSENLLLECRRLQADNESKASSLRSLQQDYQALKATFEKLSRRLHGTEKESAVLKDSNWELETKLQQMSQQLKLLRDASEKSQKELRAQLDTYNVTRSELEELSLDRLGLKKELESVHQNYLKEIADLKKNVSDLNEENDELQQKLDSMNNQILQLRKDMSNSTSPALSSAGANAEPVTLAKNITTKVSENVRDLALDSSSQSSVADLESANQVIETLRKQISKLKSARSHTFTNKQGAHDQESSTLSSSPLPLTGTLTSNKHMTPTKSTKRHKSKNHERRHSIQSSDDFNFSISSECIRAQTGTDDEGLESDVSDTLDIVRNPILDELDTSKYEIDPEEFRRYAEKNNLIVLHKSEFDVINGPHKNSGDRNQNDIIKELKNQGYKVFQQAEFETLCDSLISQKPSHCELESLAASADKKLISHDEYTNLKNPPLPWLLDQVTAAGYAAIKANEYQVIQNRAENPNLEILKAGLQRHGLMPVKEELFQKMVHPDVNSISVYAKTMGYELVDTKSWASIKEIAHNPTLDFLSDAAKGRGQVVKPVEEYEALSHPSLEAVSNLASEYGYVTFPKEDFDKIKNFDIQWAKEQASSHNFVLVSKQEYQKLQHPSMEELKTKSLALDNILVPKEVHKELSEPSISKLKELAAEKDFAVISSTELRQLEKCVESPDESQIRLGAKKLKLTVLHDSQYLSMQDELKNPKFDVIQKCIESSTMDGFTDWVGREFDSVLIKKDEHEKLINLSRNPTLEHLSSKASDRGYCVVEEKELSELKRRLACDDLDILSSKCLEHGKTLVDKEFYDKLYEEHENPSIDYLRSNAKLVNYELIESGKLSSIRMQITSPPFIFLEEKIKEMGYVPIKKDDYSILKRTVELPDRKYLEDKAGQLGLVLIAKRDHETMKKTFEAPDASFLEEKAGQLDFVLVPKKDHETLKKTVEAPDVSFLEEKAGQLDFVLVPKKDHETLKKTVEAPDASFLEEKAGQLDFVLVPKNDHATMKKTFEAPDASFLEEKAGQLDFVLVPKKDHETLKKTVEAPDVSFLEEKAGQLDFVLVPKNDHATMKKTFEAPDASFLEEKAGQLDFVLVPKKDHETLKKTVEAPDVSFLEEKAGQLDFVLVPKKDHETLKKTVEAPDASFLEEKAGQLDFVLVPKNDHATMKKTFEAPDASFLEEKAGQLDFVLVPKKDHETLKKTVEAPDASFLEEKAGQLDFVLVPKTDHESMKKDNAAMKKTVETPDASFLGEKAGELDFVLVPKKDHETMKKDNAAMKKTVETPDASFLGEKAGELDFVLVPKTDHETMKKDNAAMKKTVETPDASYLEEKAGQLDFVLVPKTDHESMKKDNAAMKKTVETPDASFLGEKAGELDFVLVPKTDHETMKKDNAAMKKTVETPDASYLEEKAGQLDFVLVPKKDHETLKKTVETPDASFLEEKAGELDFVLVPKTDHESMKKDNAAMKKTVETPDVSFLEEKAGQLDFDLVPKKDHATMKKTVETPDVSFLEEKAGQLDFDLVTKKDHATMKKTVETPDVSFLEEKAGQLDFDMVPKKDHATMKKIVEMPDASFLEKKAGELDFVLVPKKDHETLKKAVETPDASYLAAKAGLLGCIIIPKNDHRAMKKTVETPDFSYLEDKAKLLGCVVISKKDHETMKTDNAAMKKAVETPDVSFLEEKAGQLDFVLVPKKDHETLKKTVEAPDASFLEEKAGQLDFDLVPKKDHAAMKKIVETPDASYLEEKAGELDFVLVPKKDHETMKKDNAAMKKAVETPEASYLEEKAGQLDFVLVPKKDHETLKKTVEMLDASFLEKKAGELDFFLVPKKDHETMKKDNAAMKKAVETPDVSFLEEKAGQLDFDLVPKKDHAAMKKTVKTPDASYLEEKAGQLDFVLVPKKDHETLKNLVESPSVSYLREKSEGLDFVLIAATELQKLQESLMKPTLSYLKEKAEALMFTLTSQEDYNKMVEKIETPDIQYLESKALGHKLIPVQEYERLKSFEGTTAIDLCRSKCEDAGFAVTERKDYDTLLQKATEPSVQELNAMATERNRILLTIDEFEKMKKDHDSPPKNYLLSHLETYNLCAISQKDYKSLISAASDDAALGKVIELGYKVFTLEELAKLENEIIDNAKFSDIEQRLRNEAMAIISIADLKELKRPLLEKIDIDTISSYCEQNGLLVLTTVEHDNSKNATTNLTFDELQDLAASSGSKLVPLTDYNELLEKAISPTLSFLEQEARKIGMVLVSKASYDREQRELHHPSLEILINHANEIDKVVVDKNIYETLKALSESPSTEFLKEKCQEMNYCFLPNSEYLLLSETIQKPSQDYLSSKAAALDKVLVDISELEDMKRRDCSPSVDDLKAKASTMGMNLLSKADYEVFETIRSPSIQYLLSKSDELGYAMIKNEDFEALQSVRERMSIDELNSIAAKHAYTVVSATELKKLQSELDSPSEEFLSTKSETVGKVLVEKSDYDTDRETLDLAKNPTADFVSALGSKIDHVVLPSTQYRKMENDLENPPIGPLTSYLEGQGLKLVSQKDYSDLVSLTQSPDISYLESSAKQFERILVPVSNYSDLLKTRDDPELDFLLEKIKKHPEYVALEKNKFDLLEKNAVNPPLELLEVNATSHGKVLVDVEAWECLEHLNENPNDEFLEKHALKNNKVLIDKKKFEDLKEESLNPSFDVSERNIKASNQVLLSEEDYEKLKNSSEAPPIDLLEKKLESLDLISLTKVQYDQLKTNSEYSSLEKVEQVAQRTGNTVVELPQRNVLNSNDSTHPQSEDHDFLILTYENRVPKLSSLTDLPENQLSEFCQKFSLLPVTKTEYDLISTELLPSDLKQFVTSSLSNSETASKQSSTDQRNGILFGTLQKIMKSIDFCIVDSANDDFGAHKGSSILVQGARRDSRDPFSGRLTEQGCSRSLIKIESQSPKSASGHIMASQDEGKHSDSLPVKGVVLLKPEDFDLLLSSSDNGVVNMALNGDSVTFESETGETMRVIASFLPNSGLTFSVEELKEAALKSGYQLVPHGALASLPSVANSRSSYRSLNYTSTNESEYYDAQQSFAESISFDNSSATFSVGPSEYEDARDQTLSEDGEPLSRTSTVRGGHLSQGFSLSQVSNFAKDLGYILVKEDDDTVHGRSSGMSKPIGSLAAPSLSEGSGNEARSNQEDFESISNYSLADDMLRAQAARFGMTIITCEELAEYESLKKIMAESPKLPATSSSVLRSTPEAENNEGPDHQNQEIVERETTDDDTDFDFSKERPNLQYLIDAASILGFKLVQKESVPSVSEKVSAVVEKDESGFQNPVEGCPRRVSVTDYHPSKEELIERAHEYGLVALNAEHFAQIKEELAGSARKLTLDDIMIKSAEFGLVPIQRAQFEQIKQELSNPTLTKDQVIASAIDFGLVAVDKEELKRLSHFSDSRATDIEDDDLTSSGIGGSEVTDNSEDRREIYNLAKKLGLMCIPENKFVVTTTASVIDTNNVVVLPSSYYENLLAKEQEALKMTTNDELQAEAKRRGLHMGVKSSAHASSMASPFGQAKISRQNTIKSTGSSDSNSRRSLAEAAAAAAYNDYEMFSTRTREHSRSASTLKPTALGMDVDIPHIRHTSFDGGISLATVASLSEPSIIPALTQTVIGEYLHKYYRRLGAFSQISSRHERYFWVHPYTMTLYWSTNNPVLENPASNKTRAAAILGIESVEDSNPYPAGLYHKSILITTESRPIKITCATRQRHNIWFNSLRYLLQRNMDGINLDDTATDPNDANKIYQLPGETAKLTNQRLSSTRRLTSSGSANRPSSTRTLRR
ncbi:Nuclear migration protein NUM1 [Lachancea thermotolerans]